jgi:hypothetical protein
MIWPPIKNSSPFFTHSFQSLELDLLAIDIGRRKEVFVAKYFPSICFKRLKNFFLANILYVKYLILLSVI